MTNKSIKELLSFVGITNPEKDLSGNSTLEEEFKAIKKIYFRQILRLHPDKGGDPNEFRAVQTSFELLRGIYEQAEIMSFVLASKQATATSVSFDDLFKDMGDIPTPSWEYYASAAEKFTPIYKVELAKSNRSKCQKCKSPIPKDTVRCGSLMEETGTYTRWHHVPCWRVPNKIWLGLPQDEDKAADERAFEQALEQMNHVIFTGLEDLEGEDRTEFVQHVMNKDNWTRLSKKNKAAAKANGAIILAPTVDPQEESTSALAVAQKPGVKFEIPIPGKKGTNPKALEGKTVVLTGIFPELGGGVGLSMGKDRVKELVQSFGGRVTGSISGKTDFLLVGKDPGMSKVATARARPNIQLLSLMNLKNDLDAGKVIEYDPERPAHIITNFSTGYKSNGLALQASKADLMVAAGVTPVALDNKPAATKKKKKKETKKPKASKLDNASNKSGAGKKRTTNVAKTAPKKKKKKTTAQVLKITCDACNIDCTNESFLCVDSDYCPPCYENVGNNNGILQRNGKDVIDEV